MSTDPITFDEVQEEENIEEHEEEHEDDRHHQPTDETTGLEIVESLEERARDFGTFLKSVPDTLREALQRDDPISIPKGDRNEVVRDVTPGGIDVDIGDIGDEIQDIVNQDLSDANNRELLLNIAESNRRLLLLAVNNTQIQITQLQTLFDILGSVEPFVGVTVSGVNEIDSANDTVPVVPESDKISVQTRILFIKAGDNNNGDIAVGDDEVQPNDGWILDAGENVVVGMNINEETLWMSGNNEGDTVELLGLV